MNTEIIELDQFADTCEKISLQLLDNSTHVLSGEIDDITVEKTLRWLVYENMDEEKKTSEDADCCEKGSCGCEKYKKHLPPI
jgi:hypothetical protein